MNTPVYKEDHISQIPALQLLVNMGYNYVSPEEALSHRNEKTTSVLLEDILAKQIARINTPVYKGTPFSISESNTYSAIRALKDVPMNEGYISACEYAYNLLTNGIALEQTVEGDKKSYTFKYVDWQNMENNVFHVTEEYSVMRGGRHDHYRPDIVLFVNGIPFAIIECKRPDLKEPLHLSIEQHLRNQKPDGVLHLYVYAQVLLGIAGNSARYATNATEEKFWNKWEEKFSDRLAEESFNAELAKIKNTPLPDEVNQKIFSEQFRYLQGFYSASNQEPKLITEQDRTLYSLCTPARLLDLTRNFIVFESKIKKIARYPQFFAVKKTMKRITQFTGEKRRGGVIWHTQGSGKSLTMVMLAQAIALEPSIKNPKIILVTDRVDLDQQITGTFRKCYIKVANASTGRMLVDLLESPGDAVITTIINKFETALKNTSKVFASPNIFVLVDEGHRTQYGSFNIQMLKTLPNACFVAMTGTPLLKKEKNTADKFGGLIDSYTVDRAVEDGSVVPLLYEGRHAFQDVNDKPIDNYFNLISAPLNEYAKSDLKRKLAAMEQLNNAEQKIYAIAWDITKHFCDTWQGTGFKGQLVCQSKRAAVRYKKHFDEIGRVTTELVISPPDDREGDETSYGEPDDIVKAFWKKKMDEFGNAKSYDSTVIDRFKRLSEPEIIIVVDKLLTGFDAPVNTVLYLTRGLKDHTLLQAIARVNRVHPGKDFGYIIDYYGVLEELAEAMEKYTDSEGFDPEELAGTFTRISEEIKKLPQQHSELWDIFKSISNKKDAEAFEQLLRDEALRTLFYNKVLLFSRTLKIALSTMQFHKDTGAALIDTYKKDCAFFLNLRSSVKQRYSDVIDFTQYEKQLQNLIDKHITTEEVKPITELVNIFDREQFNEQVNTVVGAGARADTIASRTAKHINERMEEDPAFYKKFSQMLKETIQAYIQKRISEIEYFNKANAIMDAVITHTDKDIPAELDGKDAAKAYYGILFEASQAAFPVSEAAKTVASAAALGIDEVILSKIIDHGKPIIDWQNKRDITGKLNVAIGDYLIDEVRDKYQLSLSFDEIDSIAERILEIAKRRNR